MKKTVIVTGVVLMVIAFVLLMLIVVIPVLPFGQGNPFFMNILALVVCQPGEQFTQDFHTQSDLHGTVTGGQVYCVNNENQATDVTDTLFVRAMILYLVPFLSGLFVTLWGSNMKGKRAAPPVVGYGGVSSRSRTPVIPSAPTSSDVPGFTTPAGNRIEVKDGVITVDGVEVPIGGHLRPEQIEAVRQMKPLLLQKLSGAQTLSDKLQQIQEARDKGLISGEEYDKLRQHIMDEAL